MPVPKWSEWNDRLTGPMFGVEGAVDRMRGALRAGGVESPPPSTSTHPVFAHLRAFTDGVNQSPFETGPRRRSSVGSSDDEVSRVIDLARCALGDERARMAS
jgi:hypothetical protein